MNIETSIYYHLQGTNSRMPMSRHTLCERVGCGDRAMRKAIERMTSEYPIGSRDGGYFIINDAEDKRVAKRELLSRAKKLCARSNRIDYAFANWNTPKFRQISTTVKAWTIISLPELKYKRKLYDNL